MSTKFTIVFLSFCFLTSLTAQNDDAAFLLTNDDLAVVDTKSDLDEIVYDSPSKKVTPAEAAFLATIQFKMVDVNFQIATLDYTLDQQEKISVQLVDAQDRPVKIYTRGAKRRAGTYQQKIQLPIGLPKGDYYLSISSPNGQRKIKVGE